MRKVSMKKITEVLRLHFKLNLSLRQSASASKVSMGTASNYINRFKELKIDIDNFISLNEIEQERLFYPKRNDVGIKPNSSKVMPDYIYVHNAYADHIRTASRLTSGHSAEVDSYTLPIYIRTI